MRFFIYEYASADGMRAAVPESLRREGAAMLEAMVADFRRVPNIAVVTMRGDREDFRELAASSDWTLVIAPECDGLLATRAQTVLDVGGRLLGPSPDAIRQTADKLHLASHWASRGVRHPRTVLIDADAPPPFAPSWIIKPRDGAGSQATFLVPERADWNHAFNQARQEWPRGDLLCQQYISGQPASVALLIGSGHLLALAPARQHLSGDGRCRYEGGSLPLPTLLAERASSLALQAVSGIEGLQGYVGVDLVLGDDGIDYAIEINPRLTTSYLGLRQLCDDNLAEWMIAIVQGRPCGTPVWTAGEIRFSLDGISLHNVPESAGLPAAREFGTARK